MVKNYIKELTGHALINLLECRLDNLVYRLGFANSIRQARQMVVHGHILVNGKKVNIPSYNVKPNDVISVKESSKEHKAIKDALENNKKLPEFVTFDKNKLEGKFVRLPERNELSADIDEALIVEYYNR